MSLSREIALSANDSEKLNQIFAQIAKDVLRKGGNREWFDGVLRKQFHALHAAGFSKEKLGELRRASRKVFYMEGTDTLGGLPGAKYTNPND